MRQMSKIKTSRQISRRKVNRSKVSSRLLSKQVSRWNKHMVSKQEESEQKV